VLYRAWQGAQRLLCLGEMREYEKDLPQKLFPAVRICLMVVWLIKLMGDEGHYGK
jgi:hypothetical protein